MVKQRGERELGERERYVVRRDREKREGEGGRQADRQTYRDRETDTDIFN